MGAPCVAGSPDQLARIRADIERFGAATATSDELDALCGDELSVADEFLRVAEIAKAEGWELDFSCDAVVRFSSRVDARRVSI